MESEIDRSLLFEEVKLVDLPQVSEEVYHFGKECNIWLFQAEMGAGKTTFIKYLCKYLGVADHVSSPTFAIVNEYHSTKIGTLYHFDFYRIQNEMEAFDIGAEDYFYSGKLCLIEWPEMIPNLIPDTFLKVNISNTSAENRRVIKVEKNG